MSRGWRCRVHALWDSETRAGAPARASGVAANCPLPFPSPAGSSAWRIRQCSLGALTPRTGGREVGHCSRAKRGCLGASTRKGMGAQMNKPPSRHSCGPSDPWPPCRGEELGCPPTPHPNSLTVTWPSFCWIPLTLHKRPQKVEAAGKLAPGGVGDYPYFAALLTVHTSSTADSSYRHDTAGQGQGDAHN